MTDHPFHTTRIGQDFLDKAMPALVKEVTRLNELLDRVARAMERRAKDGPKRPAVALSPAQHGRSERTDAPCREHR
jgi:hypothetical protein